MADVAIKQAQVQAAPTAYTVPGAQEIVLKSVKASFDGTGAGGAFVPVLQIVEPGGTIMVECELATTVTAGASVDVSWFPGVEGPSTQVKTTNTGATVTVNPTSELLIGTGITLTQPATGTAELVAAGGGGSGLQFGGTGASYGSDNVGDWLVIEMSNNFDTPPSNVLTLVSSIVPGDTPSGYSTVLNTGLGMLMLGTQNMGTVYVLTVENDQTSTGGLNVAANGISVTANSKGAGVADGVTSSATSQSGAATGISGGAGATSGSSDVISVKASQASQQGTGREIGLYVQNAGHQTGAKCLPILVQDHLGNNIFEVRDDGSLHGKTGSALTFDL